MSNLNPMSEEPRWLAPAKSLINKAAPVIADAISNAIDGAVDKFVNFLNGGNQDGNQPRC